MNKRERKHIDRTRLTTSVLRGSRPGLASGQAGCTPRVEVRIREEVETPTLPAVAVAVHQAQLVFAAWDARAVLVLPVVLVGPSVLRANPHGGNRFGFAAQLPRNFACKRSCLYGCAKADLRAAVVRVERRQRRRYGCGRWWARWRWVGRRWRRWAWWRRARARLRAAAHFRLIPARVIAPPLGRVVSSRDVKAHRQDARIHVVSVVFCLATIVRIPALSRGPDVAGVEIASRILRVWSSACQCKKVVKSTGVVPSPPRNYLCRGEFVDRAQSCTAFATNVVRLEKVLVTFASASFVALAAHSARRIERRVGELPAKRLATARRGRRRRVRAVAAAVSLPTEFGAAFACEQRERRGLAQRGYARTPACHRPRREHAGAQASVGRVFVFGFGRSGWGGAGGPHVAGPGGARRAVPAAGPRRSTWQAGGTRPRGACPVFVDPPFRGGQGGEPRPKTNLPRPRAAVPIAGGAKPPGARPAGAETTREGEHPLGAKTHGRRGGVPHPSPQPRSRRRDERARLASRALSSRWAAPSIRA